MFKQFAYFILIILLLTFYVKLRFYMYKKNINHKTFQI